ncbi:MAG TPA: hypothetical protein VFZ48_03675 [Candidatus Saccharimonadales bacterium]
MQYLSSPSRRLSIVAIVLAALCYAGALFYFINSSRIATLESPAIEKNAQAVARDNDVSMIIAALGAYLNNNGKLPQAIRASADRETLEFCAERCEKVQLTYFKPSNAVYRPYSEGLNVPNPDSLHIVSGAECNSGKDGLKATSGGQMAVAVLYLVSVAPDLQQKCVNL